MGLRSRVLAVLAAATVAAAAPAEAGIFRITNSGVDNNLTAGLGTLFWERSEGLVRHVDGVPHTYTTVLPGGSISSSAELWGTSLFFTDGVELWVTNGTAAGTQSVYAPAPWTWGATMKGLTALDGQLFFSADTSAEGWEPWISNGSSTNIIKDVFPGYNHGHYYPEDRAVLGGTVIFNGDDGVNGEEPWISNGTEGGTTLLRDVNDGGSSGPFEFVTCGSYVYFVADDGLIGRELWRTDGTPGGTAVVADARLGPESSQPSQLTCVGTNLFFITLNGSSGADELWVYKPGLDAQLLVDDWGCDPASTFYCGPGIHTFRSANGFLLFAAADGTHGMELWRSDGTPAGTVMVKDIWPGLDYSLDPPSPFSSDPYDMAVKDGWLYFRASHPDFGAEIWVSDGTAEHTWPITDVLAGPKNSWPDQLTASGPYVYFRVTGDDSYNVWGLDPATTVPFRDYVREGSFETATTAAEWVLRKLNPATDKRVCNQRSLERCSFRISGSAASKSLQQVTLADGGDLGPAGQKLALTGWSKAVGASPSGGFYGLEILVNYADGTKETRRVSFTRGTHPWQYRRVAFTAAKDWTRVTVSARYLKQAGTAWFDDLRLTVR